MLRRAHVLLRGNTAIIAAFARDRSGSLGMIIALLLIPIMLVVGSAVDYNAASRIKDRLDTIADIAALSAVSRTSMELSAKDAKKAALTTFRQQATEQGFVLKTVSADVEEEGLRREIVLAYEGSVPTTFMGLVGVSSITVGGGTSATSALPTHVDFYLLLDNTPSMGVAATTEDIEKMEKNTPDQCAFACQIKNSSDDYYKLARKIGVTMRIDVVRQATQKLFDTAKAMRGSDDQYRAAIYTSGTSCEKLGTTVVSGLTSDLKKAQKAADKIDLMTIPYQNYNDDQCTNFDETLTAINEAMSDPGDGSTPDEAEKILLFVTDGVADAYNPYSCSQPKVNGKRCQEPIDTSFCKTIKDRGIKIAVLYTTYLPIPKNAWYNKWIAPFRSKVGPNLESCASDGLYQEVGPSQGLTEAMNQLFVKALNETARISG